MDKYDEHGDRYCYPNSGVLKNKLNIKNEQDFESAEREVTSISEGNVHCSKPPYDLGYFQNIHMTIFCELYDWAGEIRTVDISKSGTRFCTVNRIEPEINKIFSRLDKDEYLIKYSGSDFISKLAEYYGDLNIIHPFREGNGRVQRVFFDHVALHNGYRLDWNKVKSKDEWIQANIDSVLVENAKLESIFSDIIERIG